MKTKEQREKDVRKEINKLNRIFKPLNKEQLELAQGLIESAGFMIVTIREYQQDMLENGTIELFSQSDKQQAYERIRPVAKEYDTMIKNYRAIMKQLYTLLPDSSLYDDGFEEFINSR